jgi:hypothetical protein
MALEEIMNVVSGGDGGSDTTLETMLQFVYNIFAMS